MFDHAATYVFWEGVNSINNYEQKTIPLGDLIRNDCTWLYVIVASNNNNINNIIPLFLQL